MEFITEFPELNYSNNLHEIVEVMEEWLEPDFELKTIYEDNSDDYKVTYNLEQSHENMKNALDEAIKNYLINPKENPQVIIGLCSSVDGPDGRYNILAYFWIDTSLEESVIINKFRIDSHKGDPPNFKTGGPLGEDERFNSTDMAEFWGLTEEELDSDETSGIIFLTLNAVKMMSILNWTSFPTTLLNL